MKFLFVSLVLFFGGANLSENVETGPYYINWVFGDDDNFLLLCNRDNRGKFQWQAIYNPKKFKLTVEEIDLYGGAHGIYRWNPLSGRLEMETFTFGKPPQKKIRN